jgi:hypothetical protein
MKLLTLGALILAATTISAYAAPPVRVMLVEQIADAPDQPNNQATGNQTGPSTKASPSAKLSQSNGVINPPPTHDRGVVKPPPDTSGKAVIPPPGTPGGDQTVQPK